MNKIHVVEFTSGTTAKTITGLFQWNFGQILQIKGLDLPSAVEVHFALRRSGEALRRIGVTKDGVTEVEIPDVLFKTMMTSDYDIYAYVYVSDEEYGSTTHEIILKVKSRPMPDDVSDNFEKIMEAVKAIADGKVDKEQGVENNGKFLGVVDGYVALMDAPSGGTANAVQYVAQELTEEQQEQARANIGAANVTYDTETKTLNICLGRGTTNGFIEQIEDYVIENEIEKIVIDGVEVNLSRYAKKEETDRLSEEIANVGSSVINLEKYGIVQADLEPPFTVENYELAYNNGVGIQNAINEAKEKGLHTIVIPKGRYPLCYHASTKDEHNVIINSCGIDVEAYGCEFYVIYDEDGINPYYSWTDEELEANGGVKNSYILMGIVFCTDRNISGADIKGERGYRKHENTKYKESSFGIVIDHWANSNKILDCKTHHFSGDGIGNNITFENVYVSGSVECPSGKMVNGVIEASTNSWLSPRLGIAYNVDVTKSLQIAQVGYNYFIWTKKPLAIHCFTQDETYITTIRVNQGVPFYVPSNTFYVYVEMYSGGELTEDSKTNVNFRFGNLYNFGTIIENCESYLNQRGGMSNLPSGSIVKNCVIHDNGGAYGDMVAFYDGTQFGIDIEDWYSDSITIDGCVFYNQLHDVLFRCNKLFIKNSTLNNAFKSLNYAVDVWLENSKFYGSLEFVDSAEFGNKMAMNCTFVYGYPSELIVLDQAPRSARINTENSYIVDFYDSSGKKLFDLDLSRLGKVAGEEIISDALLFDLDATKFTADALVLDDNTGNVKTTLYGADCIVENGVVQLNKATFGLVKCAWNNAPTFNEEMALEIMCLGMPNIGFGNLSHKNFAGHYTQGGTKVSDTEATNTTASHGYLAQAPYINSNGETKNTSDKTGGTVVLDDGSIVNSNGINIPDYNSTKYLHFVFNYHKDGTVVIYVNGYPCSINPTTEDFVSWDFSSLLNGFYVFHGNNTSNMEKQVLISARMYNRCLSKDEIRSNLVYEAKKLGY